MVYTPRKEVVATGKSRRGVEWVPAAGEWARLDTSGDPLLAAGGFGQSRWPGVESEEPLILMRSLPMYAPDDSKDWTE